jgi:hypothetical protein
MSRKFKVFVTMNPVRIPMRTGISIAMETLLKSRLGTDFVGYQHEVTEQISVLEVKDETEIARILEPTQYQTLFPGLIRVSVEEIFDAGVTPA